MTGSRRFLSSGLFAAVFLHFLPIGAEAQPYDWPQWRGPNRDGKSIESKWNANWKALPPKVKWRANVGQGYSSMAVSVGKVFTLGNENDVDRVTALSEGNGKVLWTYTYPCSATDADNYRGPRSTPTVDGDYVYTLSRLGHLLCINVDSGKLLWSKNLVRDFNGAMSLWGYACSPLIAGSLLIVENGNTAGRSVIALNKTNGQLVWANGNDRAGYSSPVSCRIGDTPMVAVFSAQSVSGRLLSNGRVVWRYNWKTTDDVSAATPIVWEDKVFISSGYNSGCALIHVGNNFARRIWSNRYMRNHFSSCVLVDSHLYGFDENELRCMDITTGNVKWRTNTYGKGTLIAADGKLIIQAYNGMNAVVEANPWNFKELGRVQVLNGKGAWTAPVLANQLLFVRYQTQLIALNVGI